MQSQAELLSFMDMLDLDEELVDERLKTIMDRSTWTDRHLQTAITLLKYKQLINIQEKSDCVNKLECDFVAKLTTIVDSENIDYVCNIIELVLSLNADKIVSNSEHLVQQFLCNIDLFVKKVNNESLVEAESTEILQSFLLCESVFDALSVAGEKMTILFLEIPLENVLCFGDETLKVHFLTTTVPKLFANVIGYNILDRVWMFIKQSNNAMDMDNALKCLSCLSEFLLPIPDSKGQKRFESSIVNEFEFWQLLCSGLHSDDSSIRKISAYLIKRSIDCVISCNSDFTVHSSNAEIIFSWKQDNKKQQKQMWDNFFILLDSLDEKQTNIVLPSLKLFENLDGIQDIWVNCAFKLGLTHDSILVRLKCIEYRLLLSFKSDSEAVTLLEALNDISLYENDNDTEQLKQKLLLSLNNMKIFGFLFKCIPMIKWASIPLYHISNILKSLHFQLDQIEHDESFKKQQITETIKAILKIPCNNVTMRNAVCVNISHFVGNLNNFLTWEDVCHISLYFDVEYLQKNYLNPFIVLLKNVTIPVSDSEKFMKTITSSYEYIEVSLLFLHNKQCNKEYFIKDVEDKISKIANIVNRQYSNKLECFNHFIYILSLFNKTVSKSLDVENTIHCVHVIIAREFKTLLLYMFCLLSDDLILNVDELKLLFFQFESITYEQDDYLDVLLQIYRAAVLCLSHEETETHKKAFSINVLDIVYNDAVFKDYYRHEILNLSQFLKLVNNIKLKDINSESNGRLRCIFYEKCCEVVYKMLELSNISQNIKEIIDFIDNVIECGGYGCLLWILRIVNDIFPNLVECKEINYNIPQFMDRMWKEIEELKSNNQYSPCIEEFVNLITHDTLLKEPLYNNVEILYCDKIIEYGPVKNTPLFYLARNINNMKITVDHGQIIYILSKLLLYSPVPRKDQRIAENLVVDILREDRFTFEKNMQAIFITQLHQKEGNVFRAIDVHFNYEIQYLTISTLCKISNSVLYDMIISLIINRIDECFKNKQRYHGNSQLHRTLLIGVQHVLLIGLLNWKTFEDEKTLNWSTEMLTRLPHQPSVRICLEWIISLCFLVKKYDLNCELVNAMKSKNISISSQFTILYWLLKHKMDNAISKTDEYEFVMDTLLAHTMGQMFNVRLHGQYFAAKLHRKGRNEGKYAYIIEVIDKTFTEGAKDKNFIKLSEDIFVNDFDIIGNLTPAFIYYLLPRYCDVGCNENVDESYIKEILRNINESLTVKESENDFKRTWQKSRVTDDHIFTHKLSKDFETNIVIDNTEVMGTIQKKYIPWKNMTDINVYETGKKRDTPSELIVVASLINKLPNLGGMARTGEVFGVKTFIVDSLRHLQDKQFQGLSVSAERWVDIQEVRPGAALKEYLMRMKGEGYSVVAAEQTSTSCKLQTFKFPKKTLLLLGHEKEGVPCDLLPLMDYCIEIPQQGFVRSLNVHVTAAIFIWEYSRQNIL